MHAVINVWTTTNWDDNILGAAAVAGAMAVLWRYVFAPLRAGARRVMEVVSLVEHELKPNSGATLRDAIDRIEARLAVVEQARNPNSRTRHTDPEAHNENS